MPFGSFLSFGEVARAYQVTWTEADFVQPMPLPSISESLRDGLDFAQQRVVSINSEFARCENYIFPILREVYRHYLKDFVLWSHEPLNYNAELSGTPDYYLARLSHLGPILKEEPYLLVVEAKRDDFDRGWAQCLAAMLAAQKLNPNPDLIVHGIVTTGLVWEFGKLESQTFTQDRHRYSISHLEEVLGAIRFMFEQCRLQLQAHAAVA